MARWKVKLSDGRTVRVESDTQPSEEDILSQIQTESAPTPTAAAPETAQVNAGKTLPDGRTYSSKEPLKPSGEGDQNTLHAGDILSGAGGKIYDATVGQAGANIKAATEHKWTLKDLIGGGEDFANEQLGKMGKAMADQAGDYAGKAISAGAALMHSPQVKDSRATDEEERRYVLDHLVNMGVRGSQAGLSLIPGVTGAVKAADVDKPVGEGVGSGLVDAGIQLLGTKKGGDILGAAVEKSKIPLLLKAPAQRFASAFPKNKTMQNLLKQSSDLLPAMLEQEIAGSGEGMATQVGKLKKGRVAAQDAAETAAADKDVPVEPIQRDVKKGLDKAQNKYGTAIDPAYTGAAKRHQKLVTETVDPELYVEAATGGPGKPSVAMPPGMSLEDVLRRTQKSPDVYRNRSVGGTFDLSRRDPLPAPPLTAKFAELLDLRKELDKSYDPMAAKGAGRAVRTDSNAIRRQLSKTDPAYGKAAGAHHEALQMEKAVGALRTPSSGIDRLLDLGHSLGRKGVKAGIGGLVAGPPGALAGALLDVLTSTPQWKTMSAVQQLRLARALRGGLNGAVPLTADTRAPEEDGHAGDSVSN